MVCSYRGIKDETISVYDFCCLGLLGSTVPHAEAGNLTGVRVSNHEGTSRIVLDVSEMPVSWTQSYNEETHALTLNLGVLQMV